MSVKKVSEVAGWMFPAGSASLQQFQIVTVNASGQIVTPNSGAMVLGVLDDAPSIAASTYTASDESYSGGYTVGQPYSVNLADFPKVIFGATVTPGQFVMSDGSGHAIPATSSNYIIGQALFAQVSGDLGPIHIQKSIHP